MRSRTRFLQPADGSHFLFGPRGTGKSTWLRAHYPDALFVDLLNPTRARELSVRPEDLEALIDGEPDRRPVVIDEIQRVPELLSVVHRLIEERRGLTFILTGSSARKIRRAGIDLLGGRAYVRRMHPFLAGELGDDFDLARALTLGMVPLVLDAENREKTLSSYADIYVQEEVLAEGLTRKLDAFGRFLEAVSFAHGTVMNVADVARDCGVNRSTTVNYVEILEDLLLSYRVPPFMKRAQRKSVVKPKFYLFDAGVYRSLRPAGPMDRPEEIGGVALEGLVMQHLRGWIDLRDDRHRLHYWGTRTGTEVDAVVYGDTGLVAIEVTRARSLRPADFRGLRSFREVYPEATLVLLHGGPDRTRRDDVWCVPVERFLRELHPDRPLAPEP